MYVLCCINSRSSFVLHIVGAEMSKTQISGILDCTTRKTAYSDELPEMYWPGDAVSWSFRDLDKEWFAWAENW